LGSTHPLERAESYEGWKASIREVARHRAPGAQDARNLAHQGVKMNIHVAIGPLVALIAGILILVVPRLLNYIVALYLIIIGIIGLFGTGGHF
jgi:hypothetical protein